MKNFFKLTIYKIITTILLIVMAFGGQFIYSINFSMDMNGNIIEPNIVIRAIGFISVIIGYIPRLISNSIIMPFGPNIYLNPLAESLALLLAIILLIIETYLFSCLVALLFEKRK